MKTLLIALILVSTSGLIAKCDETLAPENRKVFEQVRGAQSLPEGMVVILSMDAWIPGKREEGFKESWVLDHKTASRVTINTSDRPLTYRRDESFPYESSQAARELDPDRIANLVSEERRSGDPVLFAFSDFEYGDRYLEVRMKDRVVLAMGESCFGPGFPKSQAIKFAKIYESLASIARAASQYHDAEILRLLREGRDKDKFPAGVTLQVTASMTGAKGDLEEQWEFTDGSVHRCKWDVDQEQRVRVETRAMDTSGLCRLLIEPGVFEIASDAGIERHRLFAGSDYELGGRTLELRIGDKIAFSIVEACTGSDLQSKSHSRAFTALYESIASQARARFAKPE